MSLVSCVLTQCLQGKMHMQQIQTPTGPKFIAVPIGQTLVPQQVLLIPSLLLI